MSDENFGVCCFCGEKCNFFSQSCGRCARTMTNYTLGYDLPNFLKKERYTKDELKKISEEIKNVTGMPQNNRLDPDKK